MTEKVMSRVISTVTDRLQKKNYTYCVNYFYIIILKKIYIMPPHNDYFTKIQHVQDKVTEFG